MPDVKFLPQPYWFYQFQHPREQERGQDYGEDLFSMGMLSLTLASAKALPWLRRSSQIGRDRPRGAGRRTAPQWSAAAAGTDDAFEQQLALAAESFLVHVPGARSTIIAGYPWFCDWGRDTMISLPGLCLATGRTELAREILLSFAAYRRSGHAAEPVPGRRRAPGIQHRRRDALVLRRDLPVCGGDRRYRDPADSLWPVWRRSSGGIGRERATISMSMRDSLLSAGQAGVQLTWMDAKVGDWVVTPRIGKPVEINALWHNALKTMAHFAGLLDRGCRSRYYEAQARKCAAVFASRFPRHDGRGLADVLDTPTTTRRTRRSGPIRSSRSACPFRRLPRYRPAARSSRRPCGVA